MGIGKLLKFYTNYMNCGLVPVHNTNFRKKCAHIYIRKEQVFHISTTKMILNRPMSLLNPHQSRTMSRMCVCCFVLLNRYWGIVMYGPVASS